MTKILYLHGFASFYKPSSDKVLALTQLAPVVGLDLDYSQGAEYVTKLAMQFAEQEQVDLIVGCSLGGWLSAQVGSKLGIPFVLLNPSIQPGQTLGRYIGEGETFDGKPFHMSAEVVASYPDIELSGKGLVLLQREDEVLDSQASYQQLKEHYETHLFDGGCHRFDGLEEHLPLISKWYKSV
ncbi:MAG: hypothetical protein DSY85_08550 [Marinomonas sp.]|nr:MAG: hypothetical protein DSY85_08550 [Marinomonas sp.]